MPAGVHHQASELDPRRTEQAASGAGQLAGRDARLIDLRRGAQRDRPGVEIRPGSKIKIRPHPQADLRSFARELGGVDHEFDLPCRVERDSRSRTYGAGQELLSLRAAVERDQVRWHAGRQGGVQLTRPECVAAGALFREDPAKREPVIRLDGRHHDDPTVGPASLELGLECSDVAPDLILGHDVQRCAEALGDFGGVAVFDKQDAIADREAIVDRPVLAAIEGGGGHLAAQRRRRLTKQPILRVADEHREVVEARFLDRFVEAVDVVAQSDIAVEDSLESLRHLRQQGWLVFEPQVVAHKNAP